MFVFEQYWAWLDVPLSAVEDLLGVSVWRSAVDPLKGLLTIALIYLAAALLRRVWGAMSSERAQTEEDDAPPAPPEETREDLLAAIPKLKARKDYAGLGNAYCRLSMPKLAAKWYAKAGLRRRAADELAKSGKPLKAAEMLEQDGALAAAAQYFAAAGRYREAARALSQAGDTLGSARSATRAEAYGDAVRGYAAFLKKAPAGEPQRLRAAEECLDVIELEEAKERVTPLTRQSALPVLADEFHKSQRYELAARLYEEAGQPEKAGRAYLQAGRLEKAQRCHEAAGLSQEAARLSARISENHGNLRQAAEAYMDSGQTVSAAESYARAGDTVKSAACYEQAGKYYRAGLAYAHARRWEDAIKALQRVPEDNPHFESAGGLLGRCFYELRDYEHCAAALDNHLTGKRVNSGNIESFYMLALALEHLGRLDKSRDILYRIRTVDVNYRDVYHRISAISSRISIQAGATPLRATPFRQGSQGADSGQARHGIDRDEATQVLDASSTPGGSRYRIEQEIGRGGMGVVFLARDTQLDRPVALKFLGASVSQSSEFRQRFVREARVAARISHPNMVAIYDVNAEAAKAYIAMEYVDGPSLHRYMKRRGPLGVRMAVNVIKQAASALSEVHESGVVHRDLKPENLLIAKGWLIKITDFGLAKVPDRKLTRTGVSMGTPSYMAPEQVLGKRVDPRCDVYALGLILYECVTGETVFKDGDVLERQVNEVPPAPSALVQGVPPELDAVVMKAIAKDPADRYGNAGELMAALSEIPSQAGLPASADSA